MDSGTLYSILKKYFSENSDLMRHLHINACWEYKIYETSLNEDLPKLWYFLYKRDNDDLEITRQNPGVTPDLTLFFIERSILSLIHDNPNAETYYERYKKLMQNSSINQVDSKINKSRFNLLRLGYQKWQKDFRF
jgi:hypothetical protein